MSSPRYRFLRLMAYGVLACTLFTGLASHVYAVTTPTIPNDFNLQITPSPLVATVKPGVKTTLELKVRNGGSGTENLKIEPRSFTINQDSTQVNLLDSTPPDVTSWISFSQPKFTVQPGQWITEQVNLNVPKTAGFNYSFALIISRQSDPKPTNGGRLIKGSVAIFTLINVDRPGATSNLEVTKFTADKRLYEYLPTTFSVHLRNSGNTIAQPYGNIFVQRNKSSDTPLGSLTVNETKGYILPGTERTIKAVWSDGFPVYQPVQNANGSTSQKLIWNWAKLSQLRIGHYTAHLVAVYNQGGRDVPIEGTVSFWVIPWKILLVLLAIVLLVLFALFMLARMIIRGIKRKAAKRAARRAANQTGGKSADTSSPNTSGPTDPGTSSNANKD